MVAVRHSSAHLKILSLLVIAALLCLRPSSFTVNTFVEENIFNVPFIAADDWGTEEGCTNVKPESSFDIILTPSKDLRSHCDRPQSSKKPTLAVLNLKEICFRIFIPPEIVSRS